MPDLIKLSRRLYKAGSVYDWRMSRRTQTPEGEGENDPQEQKKDK